METPSKPPSPRVYFYVHAFFFISSLVDMKWTYLVRNEKAAQLLKKASGNCKALEELLWNSATKEKDHANSELKDSKPGT